MFIALPEHVKKIIERFEENGHSAYIVGGCVRDSLLGKAPYDWDFCTSSRPEETKAIFSDFKTVDTGIKHGTITIVIEGKHYEVTTYRSDGEYKDNRHPEDVKFVDSPREDLSRRDFTVNALAYNPKTGILDYFNGIGDLERGIIKTVGDADLRFAEDALRILRALRFASTLDFTIDPKTSESVHKNKELLKNIAAERINSEFCKIITGKNPFPVLLEYPDILSVFIQEIEYSKKFNQNHQNCVYNVYKHSIKALSVSKNDLTIRLALFFHDIATPLCYTEDENGVGHFYNHAKASADMTREIMSRLRFDKKTSDAVCALINYHGMPLENNEKTIKKWLNKLGEQTLRDLFEVMRGDIFAGKPEQSKRNLCALEENEKLLNDIIAAETCFTLKDLAVNGSDILCLGIKGREVGQVLEVLLDIVMENPEKNNKNELLRIVNNFLKNVYKSSN